jgi:hypothetical protein
MKMRKITLLLASSAGFMAFAWLVNPFAADSEESVYRPRSSKAHTQMGIQGAYDYYKSIKKNFYTGQIEVDDFLNSRKALNAFSRGGARDNDMSWSSVGPDNIGGRTRAIWIDPTNPNFLLAGGVSGGLWKSTDGSLTWEPVNSFNKMANFSQHMPIASIARLGNGIFYIGTGSSHESGGNGAGGSGFIGGGLFRSTNIEGTAWENVFAPAPFDPNSEWGTFDAIVADPNDANKLWVAHNRGLDIYIHGNANMSTRPAGLPVAAQPCEDVHISTDGSVLVASVNKRGYISTNGGSSFTTIGGNLVNTGGLNPLGQGGLGRIEFAISSSDDNYIYASVINSNSTLRGVVATVDQGANWYAITPITPTGGSSFDPFEPQGIYDNAITVDPTDPKHVIVGGLTIWDYRMPGNVPTNTNWEPRSIYGTNFLDPFVVHPDVHWFTWDALNNLYIGNDGGVFKSTNTATSLVPTYFPANRNYVTTQFYGIAFSGDGRTIGGTQDNGTLYMNLEGVTPNQGIEVFGGDGFDCEISYIRPDVLLGSSQNGVFYRSPNNGGFAEDISPLPGGGDFTTNLRLYEDENDLRSQRGNFFGVDTTSNSFVSDYTVWPNGDITLGYVPAGTNLTYQAAADQSNLYTTVPNDLYYYLQQITCDTTYSSFIDTVDVIVDVFVVDTLFIPVDTLYTDTCFFMPDMPTCLDDLEIAYICNNYPDSVVCLPVDNINFTDTCNVTFEFICLPLDTTYTFDQEFVLDSTTTYITEEVEVETITCDTAIHFSDSLLLQDRVQSLFAVAYGLGQGVFVTRDALTTAISPEWWNINNTSDLVNTLEWSPDGNHLYIGTASGQLIRVSGFHDVYFADQLENLTSTIIHSSGPGILDIAVDYSEGTGSLGDPPASSKVVIVKGTYGTNNKVLRSNTAAITTNNSSFQNIWNVPAPLNEMPVYSCVMEKDNPEIIVVGTELGIFRTNDNGATWSEENGGEMDRVPVFDLRQQHRPNWHVTNSGIIYAGTHGRGIFENTDYYSQTFVSTPENNILVVPAIDNLNVFPNPMNHQGSVSFDLAEPSDIKISIFNISGQRMEMIARDKMSSGNQLVTFNSSNYANGTYVLVLEGAGMKKTTRFIVAK